MKTSAAAAILTAAASLDHRIVVTDDAATAWAAVLGDSDLTECLEAVRAHYASSRWTVMPVDVLDRVRAVRAARLDAVDWQAILPPAGLDPAGYIAWTRDLRAGVADGTITAATLAEQDRALRAAPMPALDAVFPTPPPT